MTFCIHTGSDVPSENSIFWCICSMNSEKNSDHFLGIHDFSIEKVTQAAIWGRYRFIFCQFWIMSIDKTVLKLNLKRWSMQSCWPNCKRIWKGMGWDYCETAITGEISDLPWFTSVISRLFTVLFVNPLKSGVLFSTETVSKTPENSNFTIESSWKSKITAIKSEGWWNAKDSNSKFYFEQRTTPPSGHTPIYTIMYNVEK